MDKKLLLSKVSLGSWITLGHPAIAEIMASAGFDWLTVDLEHSVISLREAEDLIRVINLKGVVPLARLSSNNSEQIKRIMDAGAHGVIVPMVNSPEAAEAAVASVRYPPRLTVYEVSSVPNEVFVHKYGFCNCYPLYHNYRTVWLIYPV